MVEYANELRVRARNTYPGRDGLLENVANELERLHEENQRLLAELYEARQQRMTETLAPDVPQVRRGRPPKGA